MDPRLFVSLLAVFALALSTTRALAEPNRPNVVVIVVDDLGAHDLGYAGSDLHETPHIDRFARGGTTFTAAYAAAAICSPTRASLMTGKHPARLGMTIWREAAVRGPQRGKPLLPPPAVADLSRNETTLAELLEGAGYQTFHVGKWHLGDAKHYPETHGFDVNVGGTLWGAPPTYFFPYRGEYAGALRYVPGLAGGDQGEYLTDRLTREAMRLIRGAGDQPFFLNLWYHSVHTPIEGKPRLVEYYRRKVAVENPTNHRNPEYAAMVHAVDENVGRVLATLDELDLADRTLVVVTSDNGGVAHQRPDGVITSNAPLRSGKGSLYEGGIRVPLAIRWPGVTAAGQTCDAPVTSHDLFATIAEATGVTPPEGIDGLSLAPLLDDPQQAWPRDALYWHYPHYYFTTTPVSAVRAGDHKLLHYYEDDRVELYDLSTDPGERNNLAEGEPELVDELRERLDDWLGEADAQFPTRINE